MRIDAGLILGISLECLLMIYYASTTFYPKDSYAKSAALTVAGYFCLFWVNTAGYAALSIVAFFMVNYLIFVLSYEVDCKEAIYSSLILNLLSIVGEYLVLILLLNVKYSFSAPLMLTPNESMALTVLSKFIFLICLILVKRIRKKKVDRSDDNSMILIFVPILTTVCLTVMMYTYSGDERTFGLICMSMLFINIVVFAVNEIIQVKNHNLRLLREENNRNKLRAMEYNLESEQYENIRIMKHDFQKQLNILSEMLGKVNRQAEDFIKGIENKYIESRYEKYTDNAVLNILLHQKVQECEEKGIEIHIYSAYLYFDFISDTDTVAIFANMLDNAIEACDKSSKRKIYLDLYSTNGVFPSVKIENSSDVAPKILNGALVTQKLQKNSHGIGMKSIQRAAKSYNGTVEWFYDNERKIFRTVVVFGC